MKLIIYFLLTCLIAPYLSAEMTPTLKKMIELRQKQDKREQEKQKKEWNDPNNKYLRELTKKHYGKAVHGDKEQEKLQKNIVKSIKENK
ncbi:hypothetical protein CRU98_04585 [Arcobacter sp. CECT 8986]|uniref:hypothetical protein n=1 Tax=Arcobacter sp. CECT 8986 TaxID=2044507 RepID=UPI001009A845|nr:hypothetical protein [Arcobacter sp. CECT 8986]RXK00439.1 hypothetical protein CRU98_04585 [Arcobacter sp. CECT 8986]